ncbi:hypothetical protein [Bacillus pumilus]|uniref:hypothetical protein n=1 Tax=Bacillus pumilus TaxID=1408 RepID=UPI003819BE28
MGKGRPKEFDKMIPYHTRLQEKTKNIADAIVVTSHFKGHRELIEHLLGLYKKEHPEEYKKAELYLELTKKEPAE